MLSANCRRLNVKYLEKLCVKTTVRFIASTCLDNSIRSYELEYLKEASSSYN